MLDVLRASKGGIITWIFLGAIIVVFVISFGPGSFARRSSGMGFGGPIYAAKVNGETVPAMIYEQQLRRTAEYYRAQYGDEFLRRFLPMLGQQTMVSVVNRALVIQEARRRGLVVSRDDLQRAVWANPTFHDEKGKFSKSIYEEETVRDYGSTRQYEEILRGDLLFQQLEAAFEGTVEVPEAEVHDLWRRYSDRVDLSYVLFPTADAKAEVKLTDAEVQAFAAKEGDRIEKFYKDNAARYDQPQKVHARHILARVEGKDDTAAKKKIAQAADRLKKGEGFATVAADLSDDANTKASGGDLGVVTAGQVDPAFAKAAMSLPPGKPSDPVRTAAGFEIIQADEIIPAKKVDLATARPEIARELLIADRAAALQKEKAEAALAAVRAGKALDELFPEPQAARAAAEGKPAVPEKKASLTLGGKPVVARDTGAFLASTPFVAGLSGDVLKDAVAAQGPGPLPRVYDAPAGVVVAVVKERKRPDESAYPKERDLYAGQIRSQKIQQLRQSWVAELRAKAEVAENTALIPQPAQDGRQPAQD
ncbi:MAG TPA: SurA N-terminal domain-containing protein [Anaeromyxobacter sp.]|nr:SurA N-terminal domain-containing protein [Anaeromyxobacter sp.]